MQASRRSQFEEQLRILHEDVNTLSQRLFITPQLPGHSSATAAAAGKTGSASSRFSLSGANSSAYSKESIVSHGRGGTGDENMLQQIITRLERDVNKLTKEKEELQFRLENSQREVETMKAAVQETGKLKAMHEHLKQDYESLKVSLDSSERIRKQQKELIHMLQRSHGAADSISVSSQNSVSSIATPRESLSAISAQTFTTSVHAENRAWLNTYSDNNPPIPNSISITTPRSDVIRSLGSKMKKSSSGEGLMGLAPSRGGGAPLAGSKNSSFEHIASTKLQSRRPLSAPAPKRSGIAESKQQTRSAQQQQTRSAQQQQTRSATSSRMSSAAHMSYARSGSLPSSSRVKAAAAALLKSGQPTALAARRKQLRQQFAMAESIYSAPVGGRPPRPPSASKKAPSHR